MTAQGHARSVFHRALQRKNLLVAETTAREIGHVSLAEALALTVLIAERDPRRLERASARWLRLYLDQRDDATSSEVALVCASLDVLTDDRLRPLAVELLEKLAA